MLTRLTVLLALLIPTAVQAGYLARIIPTAEVTLRAMPGGQLLAQQLCEAHLTAGMNDITFLLPAEGVPPAQARLKPLGSGLRLQAKDWAQEKPLWVRWGLEAEREGPARLLVTYPAPGLAWEMSYLVTVEGSTLSFAGWVRLTNTGTNSWEQVSVVGLPGGEPRVDLPPGADLRVPVSGFRGVRYSREYVADPGRWGNQVVELVRIPRGPGEQVWEFAGMALPPGKLEVARDASRAPVVPEQVSDLGYTPRHREIEVSLGPVPGLSMSRRLVSSRQVNARTDAAGRIALYDLDEEYEVRVDNRRAEALVISVYERLPENAQVVECPVEYEQVEAQTARLQVEAPGQQGTRVLYQVRRENLEP